MIWDQDERGWSVPVKSLANLGYCVNEYVVKHIPVVGTSVDFLFPAKSTKLSTVAHFAIEGVLGNIESKIIRNDDMILFEKDHSQ